MTADYLITAILAIALFSMGAMVGRAFGFHRGFEEARRIWDDTDERSGV